MFNCPASHAFFRRGMRKETKFRMDETDAAPDPEQTAFFFPVRFLSAESFVQVLSQVVSAGRPAVLER